MLSFEQVKELQTLLNRRGFPAGEPDGKLGAGSRGGRQGGADEARPARRQLSDELIDRLL